MNLAENWPKAFSERKRGQEVKLHRVEIRLEAQTVKNYLNFATKYTGEKKPEHLIKSQVLSITFVAASDNDSSDTDYLLNTPRIWQV